MSNFPTNNNMYILKEQKPTKSVHKVNLPKIFKIQKQNSDEFSKSQMLNNNNSNQSFNNNNMTVNFNNKNNFSRVDRSFTDKFNRSLSPNRIKQNMNDISFKEKILNLDQSLVQDTNKKKIRSLSPNNKLNNTIKINTNTNSSQIVKKIEFIPKLAIPSNILEKKNNIINTSILNQSINLNQSSFQNQLSPKRPLKKSPQKVNLVQQMEAKHLKKENKIKSRYHQANEISQQIDIGIYNQYMQEVDNQEFKSNDLIWDKQFKKDFPNIKSIPYLKNPKFLKKNEGVVQSLSPQNKTKKNYQYQQNNQSFNSNFQQNLNFKKKQNENLQYTFSIGGQLPNQQQNKQNQTKNNNINNNNKSQINNAGNILDSIESPQTSLNNIEQQDLNESLNTLKKQQFSNQQPQKVDQLILPNIKEEKRKSQLFTNLQSQRMSALNQISQKEIFLNELMENVKIPSKSIQNIESSEEDSQEYQDNFPDYQLPQNKNNNQKKKSMKKSIQYRNSIQVYKTNYMDDQNFVRKVSQQLKLGQIDDLAQYLNENITDQYISQTDIKKTNLINKSYQQQRTSIVFSQQFQQQQNQVQKRLSLYSPIQNPKAKDFDKNFNEKQANIFLQQGLKLTKELTELNTIEGDLTPEEWLEKCKQSNSQYDGRVPFFQNNEYKWEKVKVLEWKQEINRFKCQILVSNDIKYVTRLAIIFKQESSDFLLDRIQQLRFQDQQIKDYHNFMKYIENLEDENYIELPEIHKNKIFKKCGLLDTQSNGERNQIITDKLLKSLLFTVEQDYIKNCKIFVLLKEMEDPQNHKKFQDLGILIRQLYQPQPPQLFGIVKMERIITNLKAQILRKKNIFLQKDIQKLFKVLQKKMTDIQYNTNWFQQTLNNPYSLQDFEIFMQQFIQEQTKQLQLKFREFVIDEIQDHLRTQFKFIQLNQQQFDQSQIRKVFKKIEIITSNFIENIFFRQNCQHYIDFLQKFKFPDLESKNYWLINKNSLLKVKLVSQVLDPIKKQQYLLKKKQKSENKITSLKVINEELDNKNKKKIKKASKNLIQQQEEEEENEDSSEKSTGSEVDEQDLLEETINISQDSIGSPNNIKTKKIKSFLPKKQQKILQKKEKQFIFNKSEKQENPNYISTNPQITNFQKIMLKPFQELIINVNNYCKIERDLMPLADFEKGEKLFNLNKNLKDQYEQQTIEILKQNWIEHIQPIISQYNKYQWILNIDENIPQKKIFIHQERLKLIFQLIEDEKKNNQETLQIVKARNENELNYDQPKGLFGLIEHNMEHSQIKPNESNPKKNSIQKNNNERKKSVLVQNGTPLPEIKETPNKQKKKKTVIQNLQQNHIKEEEKEDDDDEEEENTKNDQKTQQNNEISNLQQLQNNSALMKPRRQQQQQQQLQQNIIQQNKLNTSIEKNDINEEIKENQNEQSINNNEETFLTSFDNIENKDDNIIKEVMNIVPQKKDNIKDQKRKTNKSKKSQKMSKINIESQSNNSLEQDMNISLDILDLSQINENPRESILDPHRYLSVHKYMSIYNIDLGIDYYTLMEINQDNIKAELKKYTDLIKEIQQCSCNIVNTLFFQIDTQDLKNELIEKIQKIITLILQKLYQIIKTSVEKLDGDLYELYKKVTIHPKKEEALVQLKQVIKNVHKNLEVSTVQINKVKELIELQDSYQIDVDEELEEKYWLLYGWPKKLQKGLVDGKRVAEHSEKIFKEKILNDGQQFHQKLNSIQRDFDVVKSYHNYTNAKDYNITAQMLNEKIKDNIHVAKQINVREELLDLPVTKYHKLAELSQKSKPFVKFWDMAFNFQNDKLDLMNGAIMKINYQKIQQKIDGYYKENIKLQRLLAEGQDGKQTLKGLLQMKKDVEALKDKLWIIELLTLEAMVKKKGYYEEIFKQCEVGRGQDEDTKQQKLFVQPEEVNMTQLLELGLHNNRHIIEEVSRTAEKQYSIEKKLTECIEKSKEIVLEIVVYKNTQSFILKNTDEIQDSLSDLLTIVIMMKSSQWVKPIFKKATELENKISAVTDLLEEWVKCQKGWIYLEVIFTGQDIKMKLPSETKQFYKVDQVWRNIMLQTYENPNLFELDAEKLRYELENCNKLLSQIQKALADYLESKRLAFPRFYFISDEDLLDILAKSRDPESFQRHINKCFENIENLDYIMIDKVKKKSSFQRQLLNDSILNKMSQIGGENQTELQRKLSERMSVSLQDQKQQEVQFVGIISAQGEIVNFIEHISISNSYAVENWMIQIEKNMKQSLKTYFVDSMKDKEIQDFKKWVFKWPSQIVFLVESINITQKIEQSLNNFEVKEYYTKIENHLKMIVDMIKEDINNIERSTLSVLIINHLHAKDVLNEIINVNKPTTDDFIWQAHQRYYLQYTQKPVQQEIDRKDKKEQEKNSKNIKKNDKSDKKTVKKEETEQVVSGLALHIIMHSVSYGFEYLGNTQRLVLTPLTDRCYRTLFCAYQFQYGGGPEGPAGTGKTETVKDLSKACGMNCLVFNASDGLNHIAMYKFFKGLASSGSWCCFDEFNRIDPEVLSVVAQQVMQIQTALKEKRRIFIFEGIECKLVLSCTFNITMNPGYKGRSELPDNLKTQIRPIAMMVPDYNMISEIYLYSIGFQMSRVLAQKIVASLQLASQQLSSQDHYDFGMRSLKAILQTTASFFRKIEDKGEEYVALKALLSVNLPKFTETDMELFISITKDLFPNVEIDDEDDELNLEFQQEVELVTNENGLSSSKQFLIKCQHLYETLQVRHGIIIIGGPSSGKSTVLEIVRQTIQELSEEEEEVNEDSIFRKINQIKINPKSISSSQLYGQFEEHSKQWQDGILVIALRKYLEQNLDKGPLADYGWIVFDGPIDAIWIENMNTVLDDNKKLCLNSGEIIKLTNQQVSIFECQELVHASPATISRCGMVYMQSDYLGFFIIIESFFQRENIKDIFYDREDLEGYYTGIFSFLIDITLVFIQQNCTQVIQFNEITQSKHFIDMIAIQLVSQFKDDLEQAQQNTNVPGFKTKSRTLLDNILRKEDVIHNIIAFSLIWSFGATLDEQDRPKFTNFIKELFLEGKIETKYKYQFGPYSNIVLLLKKFKDFQGCLKTKESCFELQINVGRWEDWDNNPIQIGGKRGTVFNTKFDVRHSNSSIQNSQQSQNQSQLQQQNNVTDQMLSTDNNSLIVQTVETKRMIYFLKFNIQNYRHLLVIGQTGTGKSVTIINELIQSCNNAKQCYMIQSFSGSTKVENLQKAIENRITTRRKKGVYSPENQKEQLVAFIDDINMPVEEEFGAQPPLELLRQCLDSGGFYSLETKEFKKMNGITLLSAMTSRNFPSLRLLRHFSVLYLDPFCNQSLQQIFQHSVSQSFVKHKQNPEISQIQELIVVATIDLYYQIKQIPNLLPTPKKVHYLINLRDIQKVCKGLSLSNPRQVKDKNDFIKLWIHEAQRIFKDRLISNEDQMIFDDLIIRITKEKFDIQDMSQVFQEFDQNKQNQKDQEEHQQLKSKNHILHKPSTKQEKLQLFIEQQKLTEIKMIQKLYYTSFLESNKESYDDASPAQNQNSNEHNYQQIKDIEKLKNVIQNSLARYNTENKDKMNLIIFEDAAYHVIKISRAISFKEGHSLLIGTGGSGRNSLAILASFIAGIEFCQFNEGEDWNEQIKQVMTKVGTNDQKLTFFINDTNLTEDGMLEDINHILNHGEIPDLFQSEDKVKLMELYEYNQQQKAQKERIAIQEDDIIQVEQTQTQQQRNQMNNSGNNKDQKQKENIQTKFEKFIATCKSNLRVILALSPINKQFIIRLRTYPSLINCTTINWFLPWPDSAFQTVASNLILDHEAFYKILDKDQIAKLNQEQQQESQKQSSQKLIREQSNQSLHKQTSIFENKQLEKQPSSQQQIQQNLSSSQIQQQQSLQQSQKSIKDNEEINNSDKKNQNNETILEEEYKQFDEQLMKQTVQISLQSHQNVVKQAARIQQELRRKLFITPMNFLRFLHLLNVFIESFTKDNSQLIDRYEKGVDKIIQTEKEVKLMRIDLEKLQERLEVLSKENSKIIDSIEINQKEVDHKKYICQKEEEETLIQKEEAEKLSKECQDELGKVLPILDQAADSLKNIKKDDLTKMKSYSNPSESIRIVMEGMCFALGVDKNVKWKPTYPGSFEKYQDFWEYSKKYLLNEKLQRIIKKYTQEQIVQLEPKNITKLKALINDPSFDKDKILSASSAAFNLSMWIRAVHDVYEAMRIVEPKKIKLNEAQESLEKAKVLLEEKKKSLEAVLVVLNKLQEEYSVAATEKEEIQSKVNNVKKKLERAEKLITGLGDEKISWIKKGKQCQENRSNLIGNSLLCASIVGYYGQFPNIYRENITKQLKKILRHSNIKYNKDFSIQDILSNVIDIERWTTTNKLPNDIFSIENAIIMQNTEQWPICIDPQNQANIFIKEKEKDNLIKCANPNMPTQDIVNLIESSIQLGYPILIENFGEEIQPPVIEPIITKKFIKQGSGFKVKLGDKVIEGNNDFRVYITSKLNNPTFSPYISGRTVLLDFTVTIEGLQDNMLNIVVQIEEPQKEQQRLKNIAKLFENKVSMDQTEKNILFLINSSTGDDILNDEQLVEALQNSKKATDEMKEKLEKLEQDQFILNQTRNIYLKVSQQVASLFFVFIDLQYIEDMYQYSLEWFILIFQKSLKDQHKIQLANNYNNFNSKDKDQRTKSQILLQSFMKELYTTVCRSLQSKHKVLFSFLMCTKLLLREQVISYTELRIFTQGNEHVSSNQNHGNISSKDKEKEKEKIQEFEKFKQYVLDLSNPDPEWINKKNWKGLQQTFLTLNTVFTQELIEDFIQNIKQIQSIFQEKYCYKIIDHSTENKIQLPSKLQELTGFQKLILLRILRQDKVINGMQELISIEIGNDFIQNIPFNLDKIFSESISSQPILFILQQGTDVYQQIEQQAQKIDFMDKFNRLSLGQGQLKKAELAVQKAIYKGEWILLQNCHLAPSFMPILERLFNHLQENTEQTNRDFRLLLTTNSSPLIPLQIVQKSIKIRSEPPASIKNFLINAYQIAENDKKFQNLHYENEDWQRIFFCITFFHAIINERKQYGSIGWNKPYEFAMTDLNISLQQISSMMQQDSEISFEAINYIIGEANYGGRITDKHDRKLLNVILKKYINPEIFRNGFKVSDNSDNLYKVPKSLRTKFWVEHLTIFQDYPREDPASIFGMDENAQIAGHIIQTDEIINNIIQMLPRNQSTSSQNNGTTTEQMIKQKCEYFLNQLPANFNELAIQQKIPIIYEESLNTVLIMEVKRYNKLLKLIKQSLQGLILAIDGVNIMTQEYEFLFNNIFDNQVPMQWKNNSYESAKPLGSWINDLKDRLKFMQDWIDNGKTPKTFWIGGFFYTQSFFTGVLQNYARKQNSPVDRIKFTFKIIPFYQYSQYKIGEVYPESGCYIQGLYLDGARWHQTQDMLVEPKPGELYSQVPFIWCKPIHHGWKSAQQELRKFYKCPVYKTSKRTGNISSTGISTNWLMDIELPLTKQQTNEYWILRGVAMLAQLDQ